MLRSLASHVDLSVADALTIAFVKADCAASRLRVIPKAASSASINRLTILSVFFRSSDVTRVIQHAKPAKKRINHSGHGKPSAITPNVPPARATRPSQDRRVYPWPRRSTVIGISVADVRAKSSSSVVSSRIAFLLTTTSSPSRHQLTRSIPFKLWSIRTRLVSPGTRECSRSVASTATSRLLSLSRCLSIGRKITKYVTMAMERTSSPSIPNSFFEK